MTAAVEVGDKWDIIFKNWDFFEDLKISEGMINSKVNTYLILTWHIDFSGLNQLGLGEISAQVTALLSATTKALNEKNSFTGPFKVTAFTEAQYNKQCEQP